MTELFVADEHSPLYDLWRERGSRSLAVCHVDFHCDMRGLLIDRKHGRARQVWRCDPSMNRNDSGSFLTNSVLEGMVTSLRWVHDEFGGRKFDDLYCVKYESDFSALPFLATGRKCWVPLNFTELTFAEWDGPRPGEYLSLDWDGLAFIDYEETHIRRLMNEILERDFRPEGIFVANSAEYSHPNRDLFAEFIRRLESKFNVQAVRLPFMRHPPVQLSIPWKFYHLVEYRVLRQMRKWGIY